MKPKCPKYLADLLKPETRSARLRRELADAHAEIDRQRKARIELEEILAGERTAHAVYRERMESSFEHLGNGRATT